MATSNFGILAKGFISGAVFTVSISYPLYLQQKQKTAPVKTDGILYYVFFCFINFLNYSSLHFAY